MKRDSDTAFLGIPFLREGLYAFCEELSGIWYGTTRTDQAIRYFFKKDGIRESAYRAAFSKVVNQLARHKRLLEAVSDATDPIGPASMNRILENWDRLFDSGTTVIPLTAQLPEEFRKDLSLLYSWDPEIWSSLLKQYGNNWISMAQKLNEPPQTHLRVNTLLSTKEEVRAFLNQEKIGFLTEESSENGIVITTPFDLFSSSLFKRGSVEMQDLNSQLIAPFSEVQAGMRVIDTCAGAGGKSLHLAALMKNKGRILALDVKEKKLQELKKRAARAKAQIIETRWIDSGKRTKRLNASADLVLIDAPCTGTGVVRRNPELKWRTKTATLKQLASVQMDLLERYSKLAKPGGKVVFAVCSLFLEEGENISSDFVLRHPEWKMIKENRTDPLKSNADGFYFSFFERDK